MTPLLLAAKKGYTESVEELHDNGCNLYAKDLHGWTALHHAAFNCKFHIDENFCFFLDYFEYVPIIINCLRS
jgi:ankyrin repeat protein